jgi:hypothetical protein
MQQQPITDPDIRVPVPTPIAQEMLLFALRYYRALTWQPDNLVKIKTFRAILAFNTNYCYFRRAGTAPTTPSCCSTTISGPLGSVYRGTHHLLQPTRQWTRAHYLLGRHTR